MFGLFAPQCPVSVREKVWVEQRLAWLVDQFGVDRMLKVPFVLPTTEYFPEPYHGARGDVRGVMDRVCQYMGVDPGRLDLKLYEAHEEPDAAGAYERGERPKIRISERQFEDRERLIATLAHEVSHELLLGGNLLTGEEPDHEPLTDLLMVFLGMGIFRANTAVQDRVSRAGAFGEWTIHSQGYLTANICGYAFAVLAWLRDERDPPWVAYLGLDALGGFKRGQRYLAKTRDSLIRPDNMRDPALRGRVSEPLVAATRGTPGERLAGMMELRLRGDTGRGAIDAFISALKQSNPHLQCEAAEALAAAGPAGAAAAVELLAGLQDHQAEVRQNCAWALGALQPPLATVGRHDTTVLEELTLLLEDEEPEVALAAADALRCYGNEGAEAAPGLMRPLARSIVECRYSHLDRLLAALTAMVPQAADFLQGHLVEYDTEILGRALAALAEFATPSEPPDGGAGK